MAHDYRQWQQFETLVRHSLPAYVAQGLYRMQTRSSEEELRATADRLQRENEQLRAKVESREAELARIKSTQTVSSGMRGSLGEEGVGLLRDFETARLKSQVNEEALSDLERVFSLYREKVKRLDEQRKEEELMKTETYVRSFWPLRYRDQTLELTPLLEQANSLDTSFWTLIQSSESTVSLLSGKFSPLSDDLLSKIEELKQVRNSLRSEPFTAKTYTPQEAAEKISILLTNAASKEDLLRRYEGLKRDLASQWSELHLAKVITAQKEVASTAVANAYISAKEHTASDDHLKSLAAIELTATEVSQSEAPMLERCFALESQLLALATTHRDILATGKSEESPQWDLEQLHAEQQKAADFSEETLELLLHISGKPKDQLTGLKASRTKLIASREGPLKPCDILAGMQLLMQYEKAKRDVFEQAKVRMEQLTEQDQEAQGRLRRVLEQSENDLATLADLASRQATSALKLSEDRQNAQNLAQLIALEEEHQSLRSQYLKDIPHVYVAVGALKSIVSVLGDMRGQLMGKLQGEMLVDFTQQDVLHTESTEAIESLLTADTKEAKERLLLTVLDATSAIIRKCSEAQTVLTVQSSSKGELEALWKQTTTTIDELVALLAEGFHKLTIDDPETKAELEAILETQKAITPGEPKFEMGYQFTVEVIGAIRRMLHDTNNLNEVIAELQEVYKNLVKFQGVMQENYYKLKPVVGTEEIPGRRGKRGQTFLHISYSEPRNPKEGMNILQEMIGTLQRNTDNLFEIESKRVLVVENSLNIKRAQEGLQRLQEIEQEEKRLREGNLNVLRTMPDVGEMIGEVEALSEATLETLEQIPNYAESITFYLKQVTPWLEKSLKYDQVLASALQKAIGKVEMTPVKSSDTEETA